MIGDRIVCENVGCDIEFEKKTHNQLYHDAECTRLATNAKIMQKYYKRRAQQLGISRHCDMCSTKLSRYNNDSTCSSCSLKKEIEKTETVMSMISNVAWQN